MIIKANRNFNGTLDLSALERIQEKNDLEAGFFRISIKPGQIIEVEDKWYPLRNIQSALAAGYIQILDYNPPVTPNEDGSVTVGGDAIVTGSQSMQVGKGTNSYDNSLRVGGGLTGNGLILLGTPPDDPESCPSGTMFSDADGVVTIVSNGRVIKLK